MYSGFRLAEGDAIQPCMKKRPAQRGDELFDVVDAMDTVIRQESRATVHRDGLLHRAIHIFVQNDAGEVFLQKRSMAKDTAPGKWNSSVSGHVDAGETYADAAERELVEELGVKKAGPIRELIKVSACAETGNEFVWLYHTRHAGPFALPEQEIETGGWFSPADISAWVERAPYDFSRSFCFIWPMVRKRLEPLPEKPGQPKA